MVKARTSTPLSERIAGFLKPVDVWHNGTRCIEWAGSRNPGGYGIYKPGRGLKTFRVHRWVYEQQKGAIPDGLEIDHLCRNRACCNVLHLEAVTHAENVRRSIDARPDRTHCDKGHSLIDNAYVCADGFLLCKTCTSAQNTANYANMTDEQRARKNAAGSAYRARRKERQLAATG